jgi:predicted MFS family arabinose efflux permease
MVPVRRRLLIDPAPLRASREFRLLWGGQLVSLLGRQLTVVAVPFQVFALTRSSLAVGLVSLAQLGPLLVCSLLGGAIADAADRRKLLLVTQGLLALSIAGLAVNAMLPRPALWPLFALSALAAGVGGVDSPARSAVVPTLVRPHQLPAAFALNQILFQTAQVVGPALAGLLIAQVSLAAAYWLDVATFGVAAATLLAMRPLPPQRGGRPAGIASVVEGLGFLRGRRALQGTFVIDLNAMVFGMPRALFPELGATVFGGGAGVVGLLYAAPGAGALLGALLSGWVGAVRRQGRAVLLAVAVWGGAIALFGLSRALPLALALLALAGAADVVSAVFRNTILQLSVPDRLRGRLSAIHIAVVTGGPRLGDAEAGAVAALAGARFSVVSGGLACLLGVAATSRAQSGLGAFAVDLHAHERAVADGVERGERDLGDGALHGDPLDELARRRVAGHHRFAQLQHGLQRRGEAVGEQRPDRAAADDELVAGREHRVLGEAVRAALRVAVVERRQVRPDGAEHVRHADTRRAIQPAA